MGAVVFVFFFSNIWRAHARALFDFYLGLLSVQGFAALSVATWPVPFAVGFSFVVAIYSLSFWGF